MNDILAISRCRKEVNMRWRQFLTPVKSMTPDQARDLVRDTDVEALTFLDVRQPKEYEQGHIPGAKLIPVSDLTERLNEIDPKKKTVVYCAIGGRSRVAAQILAGKGFKDIYNLSGGIKAWNGETALFGEEKGLDLFSGHESIEETLLVAYSLEAGLGDFYLTMANKVTSTDAKRLFQQLSEIETKHKKRVFEEYSRISHTSPTKQEFEERLTPGIVEGGMTTEEYAGRFRADMESVTEIIDIAMSIEAQALDLYMRAAERVAEPRSREALVQMANEERTHLALLGEIIAKTS
jgi:rhodanese-related sulfurtransferase/rubrerythrin